LELLVYQTGADSLAEEFAEQVPERAGLVVASLRRVRVVAWAGGRCR
jgi:hypothetical protein